MILISLISLFVKKEQIVLDVVRALWKFPVLLSGQKDFI